MTNILVKLYSGVPMKTLSLSEAKMKLSALVDEVNETDEEVVITKNGVPAAVLVSPDEFESWRETMAIRFDPQSMDEIRAGLAALKDGQTALYTLDELFEE
jgi:prevent-host-death family protein